MALSRPGKAVHTPNLGLYLGIPPLHVPERGMTECLNIRIKHEAVEKGTLGWGPFPDATTPVNLDSKPVLLIDLFSTRSGLLKSIFANTTDYFGFNEGSGLAAYLTPRYETGTVTVTNGSAVVTGAGTLWNANTKAGDFFHSGAITQTALTAVWYEILSVDSDTQITLTANYAEASLGGQLYTIRQTLTGDIRTPFFTETFLDGVDVFGTDGDRWYGTNGVDPIAAWDGIDDQVYLPSLGNIDTCAAIRRFKNIMIFVGPTIAGVPERKARTSAIGQPENVVTLEASEFVVHDGVDMPLNAIEFGDVLAIYSDRHITLAQFVGPPLMFVFRTVVSGFGPKSGRTIAQFPDHHLFLGADTQYIFDGARAIEINGHVWREIVRQTSPQRLDMIQAHFDEEQGELLWVVPLNVDADPDNGAPENAFVNHYLEQVGERHPSPHTKRQLPATATGYFQQSGSVTWDSLGDTWAEYNFRWNDQALQDAFPLNLFGTVTGDIFILNSQDTQNGVGVTAFARFSRRPLGTVSRKGTVRRVYPFIERIPGASHSLQVRVRGSLTADGPSAELSDQTFDMGVADEKQFVSPLVTARYTEIEVGTVSVTGPWRISGYDLEVLEAGDR